MTEESLFAAALEKSSPVERQAFLQEACNGDERLLRRVEQLLAAYLAGQSKLEPPTGPVVEAAGEGDSLVTVEHRGAMAAGAVIAGRYRLLERIGEGGMGEVWVAKQTEPVQRKVALKLIRADRDSRQILARFEAERQALALMDHPNIARVLDGGAVGVPASAGSSEAASPDRLKPGLQPDGRPYFVMELVNGLPLTRFCDEARLTPRQRLELFVPICQAVQHAHAKGIIHRDLKPANVLVTLYDGKAVPKIIDFGVAKALAGRLTDESLATQFGAVVGTFEYMAPEQAGFSALDVDTRADIYSLGVILYELLTGLRPFDSKRLRKAALDELVRILREEEPPRPSLRLSTDESAPSLASLRQTDAKRLTALMRGELDWIVMKCLDKDRNRRYETANGLAMDLQRYLKDEPVQAGPPTVGYRLRKFVRRNRGPVLAAAMMLVLLVVGAVVSAWQAWRATRAEAAAEERREAAELAEQEAKDERDEAQKQRKRAEWSLYVANIHRIRFEVEHNNVGLARELLDLYRRPRNPEDDLRGWEWYYLDRLCHAELHTLQGQGRFVRDLAFSPDGSVLASVEGDTDPTIRLWDTVRGTESRSLRIPKDPTSRIAFSPDGRFLAWGSGAGQGATVTLWEVATGKQVRSFTPKGKGNWGRVAFSPDLKTLAVAVQEGSSSCIHFWDLNQEKWLTSLPQKPRTSRLQYSPDGKILAQAHHEGVALWNVARRTLLYTFPGHLVNEADLGGAAIRQSTTGLAFSPDGRTLATCGRDGTARLYNVTTGKELRTLTILPAVVHDDLGLLHLAFSADGKHLITAGERGSLKSWAVDTGREVRSFPGHIRDVVQVAVSPDGTRLASGGSGGEIKIWDAMAAPTESLSPGRVDSTSLPTFSPDGKLMAVSVRHGVNRGEVEVRPLSGARPSYLLDHKPFVVDGLRFSPDSKLLASTCTSRDERTGQVAYELRLWDLESRRVARSFKGGAISGMGFSPDGKTLAIRRETSAGPRKQQREVVLWDLTTGKEQASFPGTSMAFSPDGQTLTIVGDDRILRLIDRQSGQERRTLKGRRPSGFVTFSRDSKHLFFGGAVWEVAGGREICTLEGNDWGAHFSPDGKRLFSGTRISLISGQLRVWDATTGALLLAVQVPGSGLAVHPDCGRCAVSSLFTGTWLVDARPLTPQLRQEHEARNLVAHLFRKPMLKDEVLACLRGLKTISEPVRQEALALARQQEHDGEWLTISSRLITLYSDRTPEEYHQALNWAEEAYRLAPGMEHVASNFGMALYRVGRYKDAATRLQQAHELNLEPRKRTNAASDLVFLAMAQWKLGRHEEARATLKRARDPDPKVKSRDILPQHWREAEALIQPKKP